MAKQECPVCRNAYGGSADVIDALGGLRVDCSICGKYALMEEAYEDYLSVFSAPGEKLLPSDRARLAHKICTGNRTQSSWIKITSDFVEHFIEDGCPGPNPAMQAIYLLRFVGDEISRTGESIPKLPINIYARMGSPNPKFAADIAAELVDQGLLTAGIFKELSGLKQIANIGLTLSGWEKYEAEKIGDFSGNYGFIAMKFGDAILDPFISDIVKPVIREKLGFDLIDLRDVARAGIIDNIMREKIRDSAFVIVDLTHDNSGAYWEAGYAEGLGKPVVYICERTKFDEAKTHFDTNHCTTVIWKNDDPDRFSTELIATLRRSLNLFADG